MLLLSFNFRNPNSEGSATWPQFDVESQTYLSLDREVTSGQYLYSKEHNFWRTILPLVMKSTEEAHSAETPFSKKPSETCVTSGNCG